LYNRVSYGNDGLSSYGVIINLFDRGRTLFYFFFFDQISIQVFLKEAQNIDSHVDTNCFMMDLNLV